MDANEDAQTLEKAMKGLGKCVLTISPQLENLTKHEMPHH